LFGALVQRAVLGDRTYTTSLRESWYKPRRSPEAWLFSGRIRLQYCPLLSWSGFCCWFGLGSGQKLACWARIVHTCDRISARRQLRKGLCCFLSGRLLRDSTPDSEQLRLIEQNLFVRLLIEGLHTSPTGDQLGFAVPSLICAKRPDAFLHAKGDHGGTKSGSNRAFCACSSGWAC
jgi:hypothetical protein